MKVFVETDGKGNITNTVSGKRLVDLNNQYAFHFEVTEDIADNIFNYQVIDGELIAKNAI